MGLNVKISLLVCIGFIVGMVWLVNEIGRPARAVPTASAGGQRLERNVRNTAFDRLAPGSTTIGKFQRESTTEAASAPRRTKPDADQVASATPNPTPVAALPVMLPPLHWPESDPMLAAAAEAPQVAFANIETRLPEVADEAVENNSTMQTPAQDIAPRGPSGRWPPGVTLMARDAEAASAPALSVKYVVKRGDTLAKIAQQFYKNDDARSVAAIRKANRSLNGHADRLVAGTQIEIPSLNPPNRTTPVATKPSGRQAPADKPAVADRSSRADKSVGKRDDKATLVAKAPAKDSTKKPAKAEPRVYTVRANESLGAIAKKMLGDERRWRELQQLNKLPGNGRLQAGAKLKLPAEKSKTPVTRGNADGWLATAG